MGGPGGVLGPDEGAGHGVGVPVRVVTGQDGESGVYAGFQVLDGELHAAVAADDVASVQLGECYRLAPAGGGAGADECRVVVHVDVADAVVGGVGHDCPRHDGLAGECSLADLDVGRGRWVGELGVDRGIVRDGGTGDKQQNDGGG